MIRNKKELEYYLEQDRIAIGKKYNKPKKFKDELWKFQILMRKLDHKTNAKNRNIMTEILKMYYQYKYHRMSIKLGVSIPCCVFKEGLAIVHYGSIIINYNAVIGKNCRIQAQTVIGATNGKSLAPIIGDNVYIGAGAKIIGNIRVADNVAIGANAVIVKDILEPGTTWAGIPARKISDNSSIIHLTKMLINNNDSI